MNSIITRNGLWSSLLLVVLFVIPLILAGGMPDPGDLGSSEILGHVFILLSLIFSIIGMKQHRDANGGIISYWKAVKTGFLIALFPAIAFGLYNLLYVEVLDPDFMNKYAEYTIEQKSIGKSASEVSEIRKAVLSEQEMFQNPAIQFLVMFLSVIIMGAIVSLISAFFIKNEE